VRPCLRTKQNNKNSTLSSWGGVGIKWVNMYIKYLKRGTWKVLYCVRIIVCFFKPWLPLMTKETGWAWICDKGEWIIARLHCYLLGVSGLIPWAWGLPTQHLHKIMSARKKGVGAHGCKRSCKLSNTLLDLQVQHRNAQASPSWQSCLIANNNKIQGSCFSITFWHMIQ
jgi:hypothetical protein